MSNRWPGGIIRKTPVTPAGPLQNGTAPGVWSLADAAYWTRQGLWPTAGNFLAVEDVFSTWLYTGNSASQTITNGLNLSGQGGMVWVKQRNSAQSHRLYDTSRGVSQMIASNTTTAQASTAGFGVTNFGSSGFTLVDDANNYGVNFSGNTYASWTFREAPNFFDIVTYTGNGTSQNIAHNLGSVPGMIIVKRTDAGVASSFWAVYHRSLSSPSTNFLRLNTTDAQANYGGNFISGVSSTNFTVSDSGAINENGGTYVAYLYAHDTSSTGLIQCGTYTGNGNTSVQNINLGWEPQWILIKQSVVAGGAAGYADAWQIVDNMRGLVVGADDAILNPNSSSAENTNTFAMVAEPTATGWQVGSQANYSGATYIYIAIRRGPMRTPTLGTSVFSPSTSSASTNTQITTNFPVDMQFPTILGGASTEMYVSTRLTGVPSTQTTSNFPYLNPRSTAAETSFNIVNNWNNTGFAVSSYYSGSSQLYWNFRRAPGFFDVVCYTGTGSATTFNHNLGVVPEMMIMKNRSSAGYSWFTWTKDLDLTQAFGLLALNSTSAVPAFSSSNLNSTVPTSTVFSVSGDSNVAGQNYVTYLFASAPGVSKVGSYTGNGSSQTINCAFTTGARYVLIKRTDSTGNWLVWDSARGIVAGNDPYVAVNSSAAQVTTDDSVDTDNTGFIVNQVAASNVNVNGATYIFLAIA